MNIALEKERLLRAINNGTLADIDDWMEINDQDKEVVLPIMWVGVVYVYKINDRDIYDCFIDICVNSSYDEAEKEVKRRASEMYGPNYKINVDVKYVDILEIINFLAKRYTAAKNIIEGDI